MTRRDDLEAIAVTDGRRHLGTIAERPGGGWKAIDATGKMIGTFPKMLSARDAVLEAARIEAEAV